MPLGIAVNTAAATVTGEYVVSGKLVALATVLALLATVYATARRLACERAVALGAVGAVIATFTALFAGTTVYGDALAVALQLSAIALVARDPSRRATLAAGILAALAITAKLTALWGAGAVLIWLLMRHRRSLPAFLGAMAATAIAVLLATEALSDGRFHENILELGRAEDSAALLADVRSEARAAGTALLKRETPQRLRTPALPERLAAPVLSEDPAIPAQRGERPVVLDAYMLLRILRDDPARRHELVARIARREFGTVVLIMDFDLDDPWWSRSHFGIDVVRAIDRHYRLARKVPGPVFVYRLLVPRA